MLIRFLTNQFYGHTEKAKTTKGYHKLPDPKIYWEATPNTFVQTVSDSVPLVIYASSVS